MKSKNLSRISARIPTKLRDSVGELALENEATTSEVVRYALEKLVENEA